MVFKLFKSVCCLIAYTLNLMACTLELVMLLAYSANYYILIIVCMGCLIVVKIQPSVWLWYRFRTVLPCDTLCTKHITVVSSWLESWRVMCVWQPSDCTVQSRSRYEARMRTFAHNRFRRFIILDYFCVPMLFNCFPCHSIVRGETFQCITA